jgi:hypothetical protein
MIAQHLGEKDHGLSPRGCVIRQFHARLIDHNLPVFGVEKVPHRRARTPLTRLLIALERSGGTAEQTAAPNLGGARLFRKFAFEHGAAFA